MPIFADGQYSRCCANWDGQVVVGSDYEQLLAAFLESSRAQAIRDGFARGKLPFDYCRQCRGGSTVQSWAFNQVHSYVFYTGPTCRKLCHRLGLG
jgi:hypothetical protein